MAIARVVSPVGSGTPLTTACSRIARLDVKDVILTLGVMLGAGLVCQLLADAAACPSNARPAARLACCSALRSPMRSTFRSTRPAPSSCSRSVFRSSSFTAGSSSRREFSSRVAVGLGLLAVPGVIITAFVAGSIAALAFDVPFSTGLLIGAVLAPTDPAILIPLFDRIGIRQKIEQTAMAESALNDSDRSGAGARRLAGVVLTGDASRHRPAARVSQGSRASATALGIGFGILLSLVVSDRRAGVWGESAAVAVVAVVAVGYVSIDYGGRQRLPRSLPRGLDRRQHGSVPSRDALEPRARHACRSSDTITDVVVILVFITLGANLPWSDIWDNLGRGAGRRRRPDLPCSTAHRSRRACCPTAAAAGRERRSSSSPGPARPVSWPPRSRA